VRRCMCSRNLKNEEAMAGVGPQGHREKKIIGVVGGGDRGGTVVKMLCYKSEGRWYDSRWCHWNFSLT